MKDQMEREFTEEECRYDRIATREEVESMSDEEMKELSKRARIAPFIVNEHTFEPMVVVDNVAYIIEPCKDDLN